MIHIYKAGGDYKRDGIDYSLKVINYNQRDEFLVDGWVETFEELLPVEEKEPPKNKNELNREELEALLVENKVEFDGRWGDSRLRELASEYIK